jgi:hypothetical protein
MIVQNGYPFQYRHLKEEDLEICVIDYDEIVVPLVYPCHKSGSDFVDRANRKLIDVEPTHWAQMECTQRRVRVKPDFSLPGVIQQGPAFPPLWRPRARLAPAAAGAASAPSPKDCRIHSFGA